MKKIIFTAILFLIEYEIQGQNIFHVFYGDERYMDCTMKYPFGLTCYPKLTLPEGKWFFYFDTAKTRIFAIENYKNNKKDGYSFMYSQKDGHLVCSFRFERGIIHGEIRLYRENGTLAHKITEENGKRIGTSFFYDSLGNVIDKKINPAKKKRILRTPFIPDTLISGISMFCNTEEMQMINKNKSQYFKCYKNTIDTDFIVYELGYIQNTIINKNTQIEIENFITNSGLKLGLSFEETLNIKGNDYYLIEDNYIKYFYTGNDSYYNPYYKLECFFQNNKMIKMKIQFGNVPDVGAVPRGAF